MNAWCLRRCRGGPGQRRIGNPAERQRDLARRLPACVAFLGETGAHDALDAGGEPGAHGGDRRRLARAAMADSTSARVLPAKARRPVAIS